MAEDKIKYRSYVGTKFHRDGSVRYFPGNTIICPVSEMHPIYKQLLWLQNEIGSLDFSYKYSFLPASSFHMTIFPLVLDAERNRNEWSKDLALDLSLSEVDQYFLKIFAKVPSPKNIIMKYQIAHSGGIPSIRLIPFDNEQLEKIQSYRDQLAKATGVQHKNHDYYKFHISLLYQLIELTKEESSLLKDLLIKIDKQLEKTIEPLVLDRPQMTFFDNMHAFLFANQRSMLKSRKP